MIPVPTSLVNLIGEDDQLDKVIEQIVLNQNQTDEGVRENLIKLSRFKKIKIVFKEPTDIVMKGRWRKVQQHIFSGFFRGNSSGGFCYLGKKGGRTGYYFPSLERVESYEPVDDSHCGEFSTLEEFKRKFDTRFITEQEIEKLWNSKSAQHGGKYNRGDFRRLGKRGKGVMRDFLRHFKSVTECGGPGYFEDYLYLLKSAEIEREDHSSLRAWYRADHNLGRDISISHQTNLPWVSYSSEYPGCGNGRYGLIANENEFLWLEDD